MRADGPVTTRLWSALGGLALSSLALPVVWKPVVLAVILGQFLLIRAFALVGAFVIVSAGLHVWWHERRAARIVPTARR